MSFRERVPALPDLSGFSREQLIQMIETLQTSLVTTAGHVDTLITSVYKLERRLSRLEARIP